MNAQKEHIAELGQAFITALLELPKKCNVTLLHLNIKEDVKQLNESKTIKGIKREISEDTAINVGFYQGTLATILDKLGTYHLKEVLSDQGDLISSIAQSHSETELENIIVTEMINKMSYQEFKEVASCFLVIRNLKMKF